MDDFSVMDGSLVSPIIPVLPLQVRLPAHQLSAHICTDSSLLEYSRTMYQLQKLVSVSRDKEIVICSAREGLGRKILSCICSKFKGIVFEIAEKIQLSHSVVKVLVGQDDSTR
jgi:hypothetical protein